MLESGCFIAGPLTITISALLFSGDPRIQSLNISYGFLLLGKSEKS